MFDRNEHPHRRFNPLTGEWILVSPHRARRPWLGQVEDEIPERRSSYDPACYLCPGNERAGGLTNPMYSDVFVFDNDFPALMTDVPGGRSGEDGLIVSQSERGICRVVCFSPRHDLALPRMGVSQVRKVIEVWGEQYSELSKVPWISYVQIFENCGAMMGCSNPHPHCQIWASESVPNEAEKEQRSFSRYLRKNGGCLLCRYAELELQNRERVLVENEKFVALVPFWAIWPFEVLVVSKKHLESMELLSREDREGLAEILKKVTIRYDNLFRTAFPYSMGFHQAPTDGASHPEWHFHAHFYPPLLRSATVKKFMVGYEMLGTPQRDITAESAAARLRDLPEIHYLERNQTV